MHMYSIGLSGDLFDHGRQEKRDMVDLVMVHYNATTAGLNRMLELTSTV